MEGRIVRAMLAVILLTGSGCVKVAAAPAATAPRTLPPDSAALLSAALRLARPAFATQEEALRAGLYAQPAPAEWADAARTRAAVPAVAVNSSGGYVIQVAAFADLLTAERAAAEVGRHFPGRQVVIETAGAIYRVALAGWESAGAAAAEVASVQRLYPDAWVRRRGIS